MDETDLPFRPGTISFDVLRRPEYFLGGMHALLLQIADPRIAAGVAAHSDFRHRIFDRLRHTVELMVDVGVGQPAEAERALGAMARAHRGVRGSMPDGSMYDAADPDLRRWVVATLVASVLAVEEGYVGEFDEVDRREYYQESLAVARVLGVREPPRDLERFRAYMAERIADLDVSDEARDIARHVLSPRIGPVPPLLFAPLRAITADLLPDRLRRAYGLDLTPRTRRRLRLVGSVSRWILPRLPETVRTFPVLRPGRGIRDRMKSAVVLHWSRRFL